MRLVLASSSPRRAQLLEAAGFAFDIRPAEVDESPRPQETPRACVARLAREKARAVCRESGDLVIGADTTVVLDDTMLGKPADAAEAAAMLQRLSGRTHCVLTGVALVGDAGERAEIASTQVRFLRLSDEEIAWYVATGEPDGKAGAYAIQGRAARFVDWIEGSYSNVVGLPVALVYRLLRDLGFRS